ncbi:hypothetical protein [Cyanothece sp. BG0011]|uniref:hypothetical protein n=1 Tax=Cyanothece sp. BG0011 TaxID=2082950 RepID=UPI000D1EF74B|nr:hypothetical protein [Cyanothece sp. BG0011]
MKSSLNNNWYETYLKMIYPRTLEQNLEIHPTSSMNEYLDSCIFSLENLKYKVFDFKQSSVNRNSQLEEKNFQRVIEFLGKLQTHINSSKLSSKDLLKARQIINEFENIFQANEEKIIDLFQSELDNDLPSKLIIWKNFIEQCMQAQDKKSSWDYWWDTKENELVMWEGEEEYDDFINGMQNDSKYIKAWEYWDYIDPLIIRDEICPTIQLGKSYCSVKKYSDQLYFLDEQFKKILIKKKHILPSSQEQYYPKSYYWWYYYIPQNIVLWNERDD